MKHFRPISRIPSAAQVDLDPLLDLVTGFAFLLAISFAIPLALVGQKKFSDCVVDGDGNEICG